MCACCSSTSPHSGTTNTCTQCIPLLARQLQAQKRDLESREFEALLEAGANPYAVFRQRDIEVGCRLQWVMVGAVGVGG